MEFVFSSINVAMKICPAGKLAADRKLHMAIFTPMERMFF